MLVPLITLVLSLAAPVLLLPFLGSQGLVDMPGRRRAHSVPTVRGGGVGVSLAILFGIVANVFSLIVQGWETIPPVYMMVGLIIVWFTGVGLFDDIYGLNTPNGILFLALGGVGISAMSLFFMRTGPITFSTGAMVVLSIFVIPFTVWVTNAANFMDGINGITAMHVIVACGWMAFLASELPDKSVMTLALIFVASFLGFLPWNMPRARIFLGECGSYVAGAATLMLSLILMIRGMSIPACVAPMAVYWTDVLFTFCYRMVHHQDPLLMHREHNYQKLQRFLGSHYRTTVVVTTVQLCCVAVAYLLGGATAPLWAIGPVLLPAIIFSAWPIPERPDSSAGGEADDADQSGTVESLTGATE